MVYYYYPIVALWKNDTKEYIKILIHEDRLDFYFGFYNRAMTTSVTLIKPTTVTNVLKCLERVLTSFVNKYTENTKFKLYMDTGHECNLNVLQNALENAHPAINDSVASTLVKQKDGTFVFHLKSFGDGKT